MPGIELELIETKEPAGTEADARQHLLRDLNSPGVTHSAALVHDTWWKGYHFRVKGTVVVFANDDDGFYVQRFHSAAEMDALIRHLEEVRDQAFPSMKLPPSPHPGGETRITNSYAHFEAQP